MNAFSIDAIKSIIPLQFAYAKHLGCVALFGFAGILVALVSGTPTTNSPNIAEQWALPSSQPISMSSSLRDILENPLFGGEPLLQEAPVEPEVAEQNPDLLEWRFVGIISEGEYRRMVMEIGETGKLEEAATGDVLPGGEELIAIGSNEIEMIRNDEKITLSLFRDTGGTEE